MVQIKYKQSHCSGRNQINKIDVTNQINKNNLVVQIKKSNLMIQFKF